MANVNKDNGSSAEKTKSKAASSKKKNKVRKKHPVIFTIFLVIFCLFVSAMITGLVVGSSVLSYVDDYVNGKKVIDLDYYKSSQRQTSIMYAYNSKNKPVEITRLHGEENRIWVDYDEMPENLLWAFICLEDKRFYDHQGVDWIRTIGVMIKPQYEGQGGSTITQQLIKNLTGQSQVTYIRKFNEILRALNLEKYYSKKDIIEAYLNTVYLGAGCYGVKTAAEKYFGKPVSKLTLGECATLAAITKTPYTVNPIVNFDACRKRQNLCLDYMEAQGKISKEQCDKAKNRKVKIANKSSSNNNADKKADIFSWYEEYVIDQVIADLQAKYDYEYNEAWRVVYYGGLKIYAAVDLDVQSQLEKIYKNRTGFPSSSKDKRGMLPQSSMTIMDYKGRIVALVGATGEKTTNRSYNRATDKRAKRQPGSSIKPLGVYAPAMDLGLISPGSPILEKSCMTINGKPWPRNFNGDHGSGAYISVQEALVRSLNTVPVRILKEMLGLKSGFEYANEHFHLNLSSNDMDLSPLAVGGTNTGVTTLEMASAFATFGNGGKYYKPYSYYKVVDRNGKTILNNKNNKPEQALKLSTANSMLQMLTKAVTQGNGTGYGSSISRFQTFAKTGTTSDNCDKWYCGGTPHYVSAIWYGYDYRADLHTGSSNPAKTIFKYIFTQISANLPSKTFADVIVECGGSKSDAYVYVKGNPVTAPETSSETSETETEKPTKEKPTKTTEPKTTDPTTTAPPTEPSSSTPPTEPSTTPTQPPTQPSQSEAPSAEPISEPEPSAAA